MEHREELALALVINFLLGLLNLYLKPVLPRKKKKKSDKWVDLQPKESHDAQWKRIRAVVKQEFNNWGIRRCERCNSTQRLGFAHRMKRRRIYQLRDPEMIEAELHIVVLLCDQCHGWIEHQSHDEMFHWITWKYKQRKKGRMLPPKPPYIGEQGVFAIKEKNDYAVKVNPPEKQGYQTYGWMDDEDREKM